MNERNINKTIAEINDWGFLFPSQFNTPLLWKSWLQSPGSSGLILTPRVRSPCSILDTFRLFSPASSILLLLNMLQSPSENVPETWPCLLSSHCLPYMDKHSLAGIISSVSTHLLITYNPATVAINLLKQNSVIVVLFSRSYRCLSSAYSLSTPSYTELSSGLLGC